jgi:biopolymer transport protein ExbD
LEEREFDHINMVPFIDVMLVLLTIVLMTSTFVVGGIIPMELPRVVGEHEKVLRSQVVEIDNGGAVYFRGSRTTLAELRSQLSGMTRESSFLVRADKDVALQSFVEVVDSIRSAGFKKISLQTEQRSK